MKTRIILLVAVLVALVSCSKKNESVQPTETPLSVTYFMVNGTNVAVGSTLTITIAVGQETSASWASNADSAIVTYGGQRFHKSGNDSFHAVVSGTLSISLYRGKEKKETSLNVLSVQNGQKPVISKFFTDSTLIFKGGSVKLSWEVHFSTQITLNKVPYGGPILKTSIDSIGSMIVSPTETTEFTIVAKNQFGETTSPRIVVTVINPPVADTAAMLKFHNWNKTKQETSSTGNGNWTLHGFDPCAVDDYTVFNDTAYLCYQGAIKCFPAVGSVWAHGSWNFVTNHNILNINGLSERMTIINDSTLQFVYYYVDSFHRDTYARLP